MNHSTGAVEHLGELLKTHNNLGVSILYPVHG